MKVLKTVEIYLIHIKYFFSLSDTAEYRHLININNYVLPVN